MNPTVVKVRKTVWRNRRGVVSVLAMMFLVLFGSLGLAMAVVSKGNLRTASTHLHVTKSLGAAETGMIIAQQRLADAAARFVIAKGTIDSTYGRKLWNGALTGGDGAVTVLPPKTFSEFGLPSGIAQALVNMHAADQNTATVAGVVNTPTVTAAPTGTSTAVYRPDNWVVTPAVAIDGVSTGAGVYPAAYQVTYAPLANGTDIRIIVTGYSAVSNLGSTYLYNPGGTGENRPLSRTIYQDFRLIKQHKHSIVSPSKIMIGKNVRIKGPIGAEYTDVARVNGDPVVIRSDFYGLDPALDQQLNAFYAGVAQYDIDGDNRLRLNHPTESQGLPSNSTDYDNDGHADNAFSDASSDGYVDELDIFINRFDANRDGKVVLSSALTAGTPASSMTAEFTLDDDLALQMDSYNPDRNRNGVSGYTDSNNNGRWDSGETLRDVDDRTNGYRDGVIDKRDQYAKIAGRLMFRTSQSAWETARNNTPYGTYVRGPIAPTDGGAPVQFGVGSDEMPDIASMDFSTVATPLQSRADGVAFDSQVGAALGVSAGALATYTETKTDPNSKRFFRANMDNAAAKALTGQDLFERMPFNSPSFVDWYYRPRYENMTFTNVAIPMGTNALFVNCQFIGITYVKSYQANTHTNWSVYGRMIWDSATSKPIADPSPLDKSDFLRYTTGNVADGPSNYAQFADPPVINSSTRTGAARDTKLYSNNIRFHNCTIVGTIVTDIPNAYTQSRNKLQFTGSTRITQVNPTAPNNASLNPRPADVPLIQQSSLMAPAYSIDVGQFNAPTDTYTGAGAPIGQNINLSGTIVAGELDARGNTNIDGSLLLTFAPTMGQGPLMQNGQPIGNPANFNCTLGYFGPADGELESIDPTTLPIVNGQRIAGWDTDADGIADVPGTSPQPGGSTPIPFYGFGRVNVTLNTTLPMPDGIMLPCSISLVTKSYHEGHQ